MRKILLTTVMLLLTPLAHAEVTLLSGATATTAFVVIGGLKAKKAIDCWGITASGSGSATVKVKGSSDGDHWTTLATYSLTLATTVTDDTNTAAAAIDANWPYLKVQLTAISGTGAAVTCGMGVEK